MVDRGCRSFAPSCIQRSLNKADALEDLQAVSVAVPARYLGPLQFTPLVEIVLPVTKESVLIVPSSTPIGSDVSSNAREIPFRPAPSCRPTSDNIHLGAFRAQKVSNNGALVCRLFIFRLCWLQSFPHTRFPRRTFAPRRVKGMPSSPRLGPFCPAGSFSNLSAYRS